MKKNDKRHQKGKKAQVILTVVRLQSFMSQFCYEKNILNLSETGVLHYITTLNAKTFNVTLSQMARDFGHLLARATSKAYIINKKT